MSRFKTPIIAGALALIAIIATVIIVSTGNTGYGLCIYEVSGDVTVAHSGSAAGEPAAADTYLAKGDVLTVNEGGSCTLIYRTRDIFDENYIIAEPFTQLIISDECDGKADCQLYLNRGALLINSAKKSKYNVTIRTESASVLTKNAVLRTEYVLGEQANLTKVASFAGSSELQLYNSLGDPVDRNGLTLESHSPEILGEGRCAVITSGQPPVFTSLNTPTELSTFSPETLRELITAAAFSELTFSPTDLKAAYDAALDLTAQPDDNMPQPEDTTAETTVPSEFIEAETTSVPDSTTAEIVTTEPPATTTRPVQTTKRPASTTKRPASTTRKPAATTTEDLIDDEGGEIFGDNDLVGDDDLFDDYDNDDDLYDDYDNTKTTTATTAEEKYYYVTIDVNGSQSVQKVLHGGTALLPDVRITGYKFLGWSKSPTNITSNCIITAILVKESDMTTTVTTPTTTSTTVTTPDTTVTTPETTSETTTVTTPDTTVTTPESTAGTTESST